MGIPIAAILKGIDLVLAGAQVAEAGYTKIKTWNRKRKLVAQIKKKAKKP